MLEKHDQSNAYAFGKETLAHASWHFNIAYNGTRFETLRLLKNFKSPEDLEGFRKSAIASSVLLASLNPDGTLNPHSQETVRILVARGVDDAAAGRISTLSEIFPQAAA